MIYAGAKNAGPAGLTMVIVRKALFGRALPITPSAFRLAAAGRQRLDAVNTPLIYAIYVAGLVFQWLLARRQRSS